MSRRNNVRGPGSALTEFLRESGITPTTIARRARTRQVDQPEAGPSNTAEAGNEEDAPAEDNEREYNSDNLDESDMEKPAKKRKLTKAAAAKQKAQEKAKAKKKTKKGDEDEDYMDEDEDAYTALSKMWKDTTRPPIGSLEECAKCGLEFSFTKYTTSAKPLPGFLCHKCAKASGVDPFKKPAAPKKRKPAAEKRNVTFFEERRLPSLASLCVEIISLHIDDVEALGDVGGMNVDLIAKALAKNRSLTPQNATLFYDVQNTNLTLYDATNLLPEAFHTMASLNPNLTTLRLDFCGRMDDTVLQHWSKSLPNLQRLELLGPFLVHAEAWQAFFKTHPKLTGFLITQSPRFDLECVKELVRSCKNLTELRLKEIGQMSEDFVHELKGLRQLSYLDLSCPGDPEALSNNELIDLMDAIGGSLIHLDLSKNILVGDGFLFQGLKPHTRRLHHLVLSELPELTDAGVAEFFDTWEVAATSEGDQPNPPLTTVNMSRNHDLKGKALASLLKHSGANLEEINIHSWHTTPEEELNKIPEMAPKLKKLDISWCRETNDFVVKNILDNCKHLEELQVWGCGRLTENCPRKRGVTFLGVESHALA